MGKQILVLAIMLMVQLSSLQGSPINSADEYIFINRPRQNDFDFRLVKSILGGSETTNAIISPFSVKVMLALLFEASGPNTVTERELASVLPSVSGTRQSREFYNGVLRSLQEPSDDYDLKIATKIYAHHTDIVPHELFALIANVSYFTPIERIDFRAPTTCPTINRWVAQATRDRITDLVEPDSVADSVMIMLNAVYLKATWLHPFDTDDTNNGQFFVRGSTKPLLTQFMMQTDSFFYHSSTILNAQVLRLPYKGGRFAMTLLLQNNADASLDELLQRLDSGSLQDAQSKMRQMELTIRMPRFRFDYAALMGNPLQTLGIRRIFTDAELPFLASGREVSVSKVLQKAGIELNEDGSTVFAATEMKLVFRFGRDSPEPDFNANRPFVFLIEDESTGSLLFAGKVTNPEEFLAQE